MPSIASDLLPERQKESRRMSALAKRIVSRIFRYLAIMNVIVPEHERDALEKIVSEALNQQEKRAAMHGREEMDE